MTTNKKAAPAEAAQDTTVHLNSKQSSTPADFLTVLTTTGPLLTKTFKADGTTDSYDDAKSFTVKEHQVADIHDLSRLLSKLQNAPQRCVIRGKLSANPEPSDIEGTIRKTNASFDDCKHHWAMLDIDKYEPGFSDPVADPVGAIGEFLDAANLPQFKDCSFHWQLSSSAGIKPGILKAHVWFWLDEPWSSAHLYVWAKSLANPIVDSAVFRRVQIHYTASPIFEGDRVDPVAVRSGFHQGERDAVAFAYDRSMAEKAARITGGSDTKLKDPSEKKNLIGAYHRAFPVEAVLLEHLEGMFEEGSTERRWTWLDGGGTPEGVWIADDRMHVGSSHHTWPLEGLANLWDLVRVFKFGHLDKTEGDDFAAFDAANRPVHELASQQAMIDWAEALPEVVAETQAEDITGWLNRFKQANALPVLEALTADVRAIPFSKVHRELLAKECQTRMKLITGIQLSIGDIRTMLAHVKVQPVAPPALKSAIPLAARAPAWLSGWCYVTSNDKYYNYDTRVEASKAGFEVMYSRDMHPYMDEKGKIPSAVVEAARRWHLHYVHLSVYMPSAGALFTHRGHACVNTFHPNSLPVAADVLSPGDLDAIALIERHLLLLCGGRRDIANHILGWVAHNVQHPGVKINYSPMIQGIEGCGKSVIGDLIAAGIGEANIKKISPQTLSDSAFTGWAMGGCVCILEEVRLLGHNRFDVINKVKPLITDSTIEVHPKGVDPYTVPNTMNYMAFTNYKDALPLNDTDRRWLVVFAPWASIADFSKEIGESPDTYFDRLHAAIRGHGPGIRRWLLDRDLFTFDPHGRAPHTEEKKIAAAMGVSEDLDMAKLLIEEGHVGVSHDVVSTSLLSRAFTSAGLDAPNTTRMRSLMADLGYQPFTDDAGKGRPVKWRRENHRVWTRGKVENEVVIRKMLDATERAQVERDFAD